MKYAVIDTAGRFLASMPQVSSLGVFKGLSYTHHDAIKFTLDEAKAIANQLGDGWFVYNLQEHKNED